MRRVYLDHNATRPLKAEARSAMLAAMDVPGNPSSVHAEGRGARAVVERARAQVAALVGCMPSQVVFTGSATEAAALAVAQKNRHGGRFVSLATEHDCFLDWHEGAAPIAFDRAGAWRGLTVDGPALVAISAANSETGVMLPVGAMAEAAQLSVITDLTQMAGKVPVSYGVKPDYAILSAHKIGGPKGVGALISFGAEDPQAILRGGGQEMGRRSGTENVIGIAGFGAAAAAAKDDIEADEWARVEKLRNILEDALETGSKDSIFVGRNAKRLPNTTCVVTPGWKGETQVMQMDLAGFAVSAGSACSSGKVQASKVLRAMGFSENEAACAMRVSLGPETEEEDVLRFAESWTAQRKKQLARSA